MKIELSRNLLFIIFITVIIVIAIAPSAFFYKKYSDAQKILKDPTELIKLENKALIAKVGKIIDLPEGEEPEVRTIVNKADLSGQPFFAKAENGDKILVYSQAKKAYIYRPSLNKIINVAPVNLAIASPAPAVASAQTSLISPTLFTPSGSEGPTPLISPISLISPTVPISQIKFFLLNGTTKIGLTQKYEPVLKKSLSNAVIVDRDSAKKNDYTKSILILINESKGKEAEQISKALNLPLEKLPEGEEKPKDTDFLIILGTDKQNL